MWLSFFYNGKNYMRWHLRFTKAQAIDSLNLGGDWTVIGKLYINNKAHRECSSFFIQPLGLFLIANIPVLRNGSNL